MLYLFWMRIIVINRLTGLFYNFFTYLYAIQFLFWSSFTHHKECLLPCTEYILCSVSPSEVPAAQRMRGPGVTETEASASTVMLVLSRIHHQPVSLHPSGRGDLHPGQICKHQFNLHGERYCHQKWQQKPVSHAAAQRVTPPQYCCQIPTLSYYGHQGSCHWEARLYPPVSAWLPERPVHACMWLRWAW